MQTGLSQWLDEVRGSGHELLTFPAGRHDDQVDALGLVGQLLDRMFVPPKPKSQIGALRDRWDRLQEEVVNWKTV